MVSLIQLIEFSIVVSLSILAGYFIGITTQEEIEKKLRKFPIDKIFSYPLIAAEVLVILILLKFAVDYYFLAGNVLIIINIVLSSIYSAKKMDLQRILAYTIMFLIANLIIGTIIII